MGGGGVQRTVKFVKYLKRFGYEPIIFTVDYQNHENLDSTLGRDLPENTKVYRGSERGFGQVIKKIFPSRFLHKLWELLYFLFVPPDEQIRWFLNNKKLVEKIVKKEKIKIIYTSASPYSAHYFGLFLKKRIPDIKWVADFRDAWVTNPGRYMNFMFRTFFFLRNKIDFIFEEKVVKQSDFLVTASEGITEDLINRHKMQHESNRFITITNGLRSR